MNKLISFFKKAIFSNNGYVLILRCTGIALTFLLTAFISSNYGAATFGRYSIAISSLEFFSIIASLGVSTCIVKLSSDKNFLSSSGAQNNYFYSSLLILIISSILFAILIFFIKELISLRVFNDELLIGFFTAMVYGVPLFIFYNFFCEFEKGRFNFVSYGLARFVLLPLFTVVLILFFSKYQLSEHFLICSFIFALLLLNLGLISRVPFKNLFSNKPYSPSQVLSLSLPMMLSSSFIFLTNWTDVFMLGVLVDKTELGIYSVAFKISTISILITISVNSVVAPSFSRLYEQQKYGELRNKALDSIKIISILTIPIVLLIFIFRTQLLSIFGEEFVQGECVLVVILIGNLFNALTGTVGSFLNMTHNHKALKNYTFVSAILNIILNYIFIITFGVLGAAIATTTSTIVLNILCVIKIKKEFGFYAVFQR